MYLVDALFPASITESIPQHGNRNRTNIDKKGEPSLASRANKYQGNKHIAEKEVAVNANMQVPVFVHRSNCYSREGKIIANQQRLIRDGEGSVYNLFGILTLV